MAIDSRFNFQRTGQVTCKAHPTIKLTSHLFIAHQTDPVGPEKAESNEWTGRSYSFDGFGGGGYMAVDGKLSISLPSSHSLFLSVSLSLSHPTPFLLSLRLSFFPSLPRSLSLFISMIVSLPPPPPQSLYIFFKFLFYTLY